MLHLLMFLNFFIISSKHGLECIVKVTFWHTWWWWCNTCRFLSRRSDVITGAVSFVCRGRHNNEYSFVGLVERLYAYPLVHHMEGRSK